MNEERAFARFEIENARAAVQRVEEALQEHERMSEASGKQVWIIPSSIMLSVFFSQFKYISFKYNEFMKILVHYWGRSSVNITKFQLVSWALILSSLYLQIIRLEWSSFREFYVSFGLDDVSQAKIWVIIGISMPISLSSLQNYGIVF